MIGTTYTITNRDGELIKINDHVTNPNQIIALQEYPSFDVDIKNNEIDREGQHGIWDFYSYFGKRIMTFSGVIVGATEQDVEAVKNKLIKVTSIPLQSDEDNDGYVVVKWTDVNGESWQVEAKLIKSIQFGRPMKQNYRLDFNFSLKANDPYLYSQTLNTQVGIRGYIQQGAQFPIELPATIGQNLNNLLTVTNDGEVSIHTLIRIYGEDQGDITNPKIENRTTGKTFQINTVITGASNWIEIDSNEGTVVDQSGADLSGDIDTESEFILLAPGSNELLYTSDEDPVITLESPTAPWSIKFRTAKI